jgi:hypothetical protein
MLPASLLFSPFLCFILYLHFEFFYLLDDSIGIFLYFYLCSSRFLDAAEKGARKVLHGAIAGAS